MHHFSRQLMVSLSCECCDDYDNDDDDINKGHGQLTTAASLTRWQLSWPGSKSPGSSSRIVYIMLLHPILLAPKVFLDFLRPMITIQSHHILSATKPLNHQNRPQAVSSRSFDLLNSMIYDLKWSEDQSVTFWCRYWSRDRNWDYFGLEYGLETSLVTLGSVTFWSQNGLETILRPFWSQKWSRDLVLSLSAEDLRWLFDPVLHSSKLDDLVS